MLGIEENAPEGAMKAQLIGRAISPEEEEEEVLKKGELEQFPGVVYYPRHFMSSQAKSLFVARSTQTHLCPGCMSQLRNGKWHGMCTCSKYQFVEPPAPKTTKTDSTFRSGYQVFDPPGKEIDASFPQGLARPEPENLSPTQAPKDIASPPTDSGASRRPSVIGGGTEGFSDERDSADDFRTPPVPARPALTPHPPPVTQEGRTRQDSFFEALYLMVFTFATNLWTLAETVVWPTFLKAVYLCLAYWLVHRLLLAIALYVKTPGIILNVFFVTSAGELRERIVVR